MRWALAVLAGLLLAGCGSPAATTPADEVVAPVAEPALPGTLFAAARHCTAVDYQAQAVLPDLLDRIPDGWSTPSPGVADLRVLLLRCVDTFAALLTLKLRTGGPTDTAAPIVDYVLQVFTNSTVDDWAVMGAPVAMGTCAYSSEGGDDVWTVTAPDLAVRLAVHPIGDPGVQHEAAEQYAANDPVVWSWGRELATITRPVQGSVTFGPASVLSNAQVVTLLDATVSERWGAVNAEYRTGMAPDA